MQKLLATISVLFSMFVTQAQNLDIDIVKSLNKNTTTIKDNYLELCASSVTVVSIAAPVGVITAGLIKHNKQLQLTGLYMAGAYVASAIVTRGLKVVVDRPRPFEKYSFIIKRDDESGGKSFPSGHTSAAFCTATALSINFPKWYVIVPSYLYAASVGWARMYQGVHYPSDVLAGAAIGAGSAWLSHYIQKRLDYRKAAKKKPSL